jgi:hypothetical protein
MNWIKYNPILLYILFVKMLALEYSLQHHGKLLFCETVCSRGSTCKEITLGTNFPLGYKSASTYLPKDADWRGLSVQTWKIRELISAVNQPEVDSSVPFWLTKFGCHLGWELPTPFTCSFFGHCQNSHYIVSVQVTSAVRLLLVGGTKHSGQCMGMHHEFRQKAAILL